MGCVLNNNSKWYEKVRQNWDKKIKDETGTNPLFKHKTRNYMTQWILFSERNYKIVQRVENKIKILRQSQHLILS